MKTISVVMTVYNDERFLDYSINSILEQTFLDFEFIIVNDGSTDKTKAILEKYALKDERIKIINQKNSGTTIAANYGIKISKGEYIARLDSDDYSYPYRLEYEKKILDENPCIGLVGGGIEIIDMENNIIGERNIFAKNPKRVLKHRCIFQQSDVMFRKSIFEMVGGYREKFKNAQDYDLWLRMSEKCDIYKSQMILGQWRLNAGGYTLSRSKEQKSEVKQIKYFYNQRNKTGKDNYPIYQSKHAPIHRIDIDNSDYNLIVGIVLIQNLNKKSGRVFIWKSLKKNVKLLSIIFIILSFSPKLLLKGLFKFRNYVLNNF